jgi:hypothetical protein
VRAPPTAWTSSAGTERATHPSGTFNGVVSLLKRLVEIASPEITNEETCNPFTSSKFVTHSSGNRSESQVFIVVFEEVRVSPGNISFVATRTSTCSPP